MTDKKPRLPRNEVFEKAYNKLYMSEGATELGGGQVAQILFEAGYEQGKLDLVELIRKEMDKMGDDEPGGIMCHRRECFESGICFHEIERLARLKSQLSKQGVKK